MKLQAWIVLWGIVGSVYGAPSWVMTPPMDTPSTLYGVAEGQNLTVSTQNALAMIASRLGVTLSSTQTTQTTQTTHGSFMGVNKDVTFEVKAEVKPLSFGSYELLQTAVEEGKTYTLVSVDKQKFVDEKKGELETIFRTMLSLDQQLLTASTHGKLALYQTLRQQAKLSDRLRGILQTLQPTLNLDPYTQISQKIAQEYPLFLRSITLVIRGSAIDRPFMDVVKKSAANNQLKLSYKPTDTALILDMESNTITKNIFGRYMVKSYFSIAVKNSANETLHTTSWVAQGSSAIDFSTAKMGASEDLYQQIEQKGFLTLLGVDR